MICLRSRGYLLIIIIDQVTQRIHQLMDEPHFLGFLCLYVPAGQHHIKRSGKTNLRHTLWKILMKNDVLYHSELGSIYISLAIWASKLLTILGSLWVPPAPGSSPSITSGVPRIVFLLLVAIRYWHATANWKKRRNESHGGI